MREYFGPDDKRSKTIVGAWRAHDPPAASSPGVCPLSVGDVIDVWWISDETGEGEYYAATVLVVSTKDASATVHYPFDGQIHVHDFGGDGDVQWRRPAAETVTMRNLVESSTAALRRATHKKK